MTVRAGKLRHRLIVEAKETTLGTRGQRTGSWTTCDTVWGEVVTLSGGERDQARQIYASATDTVRIRYRADLTTENRFKFGSRILNIGHIDNIDQRNIEIVMLCGEDR